MRTLQSWKVIMYLTLLIREYNDRAFLVLTAAISPLQDDCAVVEGHSMFSNRQTPLLQTSRSLSHPPLVFDDFSERRQSSTPMRRRSDFSVQSNYSNYSTLDFERSINNSTRRNVLRNVVDEQYMLHQTPTNYSNKLVQLSHGRRHEDNGYNSIATPTILMEDEGLLKCCASPQFWVCLHVLSLSINFFFIRCAMDIPSGQFTLIAKLRLVTNNQLHIHIVTPVSNIGYVWCFHCCLGKKINIS